MLSTTQLIILGLLFLIILIIVLKMDNPVYEYYSSSGYDNIFYSDEIDNLENMNTKTIVNDMIYNIPYINSGKSKTVFILCPLDDNNNINDIKNLTMNINSVNDNKISIWKKKFNDDNVNSEINKFYIDKKIKYMKIDLDMGVIPMDDSNKNENGLLNIKFSDSTPKYYKIGTHNYKSASFYQTNSSSNSQPIADSSSNSPPIADSSSNSPPIADSFTLWQLKPRKSGIIMINHNNDPIKRI